METYKSACTTFSEFLEEVKNDRGLEGCVLRYLAPLFLLMAQVLLLNQKKRFDNGMMVKIKTMWYHDLNRGLHMMTKTKQNNERFMWKTILDSKYDDMKVPK